MKSALPALISLINGGTFQYCHLYTITLPNAIGGQSVIRLTDSEIDVWSQPRLSPGATQVNFTGLVGYYPMNITSAVNANDFSGQGNNGSVVGSPISIALGPVVGPGVYFNSANPDYFTFPSQLSFGSHGACSLVIWFRTAFKKGTIFGNANSLTYGSITTTVPVLYVGTDGKLYAGTFDTAFRQVVSANSVADGKWHQAIVTQSAAASGTLTFYLDGVLVGTVGYGTQQTMSVATIATGKSDTWPNAAGSGAYDSFNGDLGVGLIYNRAITLTEVTTLYGVSAQIYSSKTVQIDQRANKRLAHWKRGLDVDQAVVVLAPRPTDPTSGAALPDTIGSLPFFAAAIAGALDGADVQIDRAFFNSWPNPYSSPIIPVGTITLFAGTPAEIDVNDTMVVLTLNDYRQLLQNKYPRVLYQLGCTNTLYDAGCTLNPNSFAVTGVVVAAGSTRGQIISTTTPTAPVSPGSGTFQLGKITFTSGQNQGFSRTIRHWNGATTFQLLNPFPFTPVAGDIFTVFEGCDKQQTTCTAFANLANFGGQPFTPDATNAA